MTHASSLPSFKTRDDVIITKDRDTLIEQSAGHSIEQSHILSLNCPALTASSLLMYF